MERKNPFDNKFPAGGILPGVSAVPGMNDMKSAAIFAPDMRHGDEAEDEEITDEMIKDYLDDLIVRKEEWKYTHPLHLVCGSDDYYASLASSISVALLPVRLPDDAPDGIMHEIAMTCTSYLEDIVSGFGVWNVFRNLYRREYGKWLPFYDCEHDDYLLDNVNIEDVKYIVWQCFCRCGQEIEIVYSPFSEGVEKISKIVYDIIEPAFEEAPEAVRVRDYIRRVIRKGDYFEVRTLAEWLMADSKLISSPNMALSIIREAEALSRGKDMFTPEISLYFVRSVKAWSERIGPLGCPASVYLSEMSREFGNDGLAGKLDGLECISVALFRVKDIGKKTIVLEDVSGECYEVEKNSFGKGARFKEVKGYMTSIVKFGAHWLQNGMATGLTEDPFNDRDNRKEIHTMEMMHKNAKSREWLEDIVDRNDGKRIFYCRDMEDVSSILGVPYKGDESQNNDACNFVLMLSKDEGMVLLRDYAQVFKEKGNPFYNKREAKEDSLRLIADGVVPADIGRIIADNKLLPDAELNAAQGKRFGKAIVQDNMAFLFGFFRSESPKVDY